MLSTWLLCALVLSASYSGSLRAFLVAPLSRSAVDTAEDVLDSGLPWNMVDYGSVRDLVARGEGNPPALQRLLDGMVTVEFSDFPVDRVTRAIV